MLNLLAEILLWIILQSWFNENVSNVYIQKECVGLTVSQKGWWIWIEVFNSWYILYFFPYILLAFQFSAHWKLYRMCF